MSDLTSKGKLRDFAEEINGVRPSERSIQGITNNLINNYKGGTEVIANPELEGNEDLLNGLQVGDTRYATPHLYLHYIAFDEIRFNDGGADQYGYIHLSSPIISTKSTKLTREEIFNYLISDGDYHQLGVVGVASLNDLQYIEGYELSENSTILDVYINSNQSTITTNITEDDINDNIIQLF